jgi:hypothetical protein
LTIPVGSLISYTYSGALTFTAVRNKSSFAAPGINVDLRGKSEKFLSVYTLQTAREMVKGMTRSSLMFSDHVMLGESDISVGWFKFSPCGRIRKLAALAKSAACIQITDPYRLRSWVSESGKVVVLGEAAHPYPVCLNACLNTITFKDWIAGFTA